MGVSVCVGIEKDSIDKRGTPGHLGDRAASHCPAVGSDNGTL